MSFYIARKDGEKCQECGSCEELLACPADFKEKECVGCGACSLACPYETIEMVEKLRGEIEIEVDGKTSRIPEQITVKKALEELGYEITKFPDKGLFAPCEVGGCYSCAVEIDGIVKQSCITPVKEGMRIRTELPENYTPKRIVGGFMGHTAGGVGTPWYLKERGYIETAVFAAGCNFRCPQCQNWTTTYRGKGNFGYHVLTPRQAAEEMTRTRHRYGVNRMAISGGECTLNRKWLVQYVRELRQLNPDKNARIHVDTNGSLLTKDYIDELVEAGMTDVGIDLKSLNVKTFMHITGSKDERLAERYKTTAWNATKYLIESYKDKVFLGIGIPYNEKLISLEEIELMGREIARVDSEVQVCALDYRPEFRRQNILKPSYQEMKRVYEILKNSGLKTVICQTTYGHIGP